MENWVAGWHVLPCTVAKFIFSILLTEPASQPGGVGLSWGRPTANYDDNEHGENENLF